MKTNTTVRIVKISDASVLRSLGVFNGSLENIADKIRGIISDPYTDIFLTETAAFTVQKNPVYQRNCLISPFGEFSDSVLRSLTDILFNDYSIFKISFLLRENDEDTEEMITSLGGFQEALLRDELLSGELLDAGLFSITRPEYKGNNVALIPFTRAVMYVKGSDKAVFESGFLQYGSEINDDWILDVARYKGYTDGNCIKKRGDEVFNSGDESEAEFLPSELGKAYIELREYFSKRREKFDVNIEVEGTDFQKKVWNEINTIPYSFTCSYEDIAYIICGNNVSKARLTCRAVGKACSQNPVPVLVPCHRVLSSDGNLLGYSGGLEIKDFLLNHEAFSTLRL